MDYGDSLPEAEKIWLRNFTSEYYGSTFIRGEKHLHDDAGRRECQRRQRGHAGDKRPDLMSFSPMGHRLEVTAATEGATGGEGELIDALDAKAARAWAKKNPLLVSHARFVNQELQRAKRRLRYVKLIGALKAKEKLVAFEDKMNRDANDSTDNWHSEDAKESTD
jgi:hypothetical protein